MATQLAKDYMSMLVKDIPYTDLLSSILMTWGSLTIPPPATNRYPNNLLAVYDIDVFY
jgi:hypothetical protein